MEGKQYRRIPVGVRLKCRDATGREVFMTHSWEAVEDTEKGQAGITLTTGRTANDADAVFAEVEIHLGVYWP